MELQYAQLHGGGKRKRAVLGKADGRGTKVKEKEKSEKQKRKGKGTEPQEDRDTDKGTAAMVFNLLNFFDLRFSSPL